MGCVGRLSPQFHVAISLNFAQLVHRHNNSQSEATRPRGVRSEQCWLHLDAGEGGGERREDCLNTC